MPVRSDEKFIFGTKKETGEDGIQSWSSALLEIGDLGDHFDSSLTGQEALIDLAGCKHTELNYMLARQVHIAG